MDEVVQMVRQGWMSWLVAFWMKSLFGVMLLRWLDQLVGCILDEIAAWRDVAQMVG